MHNKKQQQHKKIKKTQKVLSNKRQNAIMMPTNKNVFIQRRYVPTKHENVFVDFFKTLIKTFLLIRTVKNGGITMKEKWQTFVRDIRKQAGLQVMVIPGIIF